MNEVLDLYVSPAGHDRWSGSFPVPRPDGTDGPLASLAGARDAIRRGRASGQRFNRPVTVHVADGFYELPETLRFISEDGGTADAPVCYIAAEGAAPVVSGGRRLTGWHETQHQGLRCWVVDLPDVAAGRWSFSRLYVNHMARPRTRLPRRGYYRFTGIAGCEDSGFNWCQGPDRANFASGEIVRWHNWEDVDLISYQLWFDTHHRFKAIDEAAGVVHFHARSLGSLKDEQGQFARYFVENVFEALDTPGQWYLDRPAGRLYYLPLPDETPATTEVVAPRLTELVRVQGEAGRRVAHLHFENLTFAHQHWELPRDCPGYIQAAWGVPGAIILEGADRNVFYGCTIAHVNGYGLELLAGSSNNVLAACSVYDTGGGGIKIGHEQLRRSPGPTVSPQAIEPDPPAMATTVVDCTIRDTGHIFPSAIGIWVGNSGWNRLFHNHIFNGQYTGISCGWEWGYAPTRTVSNRIENNHIHHVNHQELLSDNGGIYTLGQQPGTILRGNVIHDISCYGYGAWGIYPDEGSSEMRVEHNLVYGTKKASFSTHYGRDNLVQHNIFALSQNDHLSLGKREGHRSTVFRRNVVVPANGRVQPGGWGLWRLAHYTVADNLFWPLDGTSLVFAGQPLSQIQEQGQNLGAIVADPLFTDAAGGDFSLRSDTPAKRIGFKPFDWRAAGPRLKTDRPFRFEAYTRRWPLPAMDVPVVRTRIELITPLADVPSLRMAVFEVTLTNVGRVDGRGTVRLSGGPKGIVGRASVRRIAFALAPGEERRETVTLKVRRGASLFWLDSEPSNEVTVPARRLVFPSIWPVSRVPAADGPGDVGRVLAEAPGRKFHRCAGQEADVKLGSTHGGVLLLARLLDPILQPNPAVPWKGSAIELIATEPPSGESPATSPAVKRKIFLVPHADGRGADGFWLLEPGGAVEPAPDIRVEAKPLRGGCTVAAVIPWSRFGFMKPPAEFPFEMHVYFASPASGGAAAVSAFDLPWDGWRRQFSRLVVVESGGQAIRQAGV